MASSLLSDHVVHKYGDHDLQTLSVWQQIPALTDPTHRKYWIIYIHGGAWRAADINNETFLPTIKSLYSSHATVVPHIAAFASIDYRLSPHPNLPQDKETTSCHSLRGARHPDHINDVSAAISFLQKQYAVKDNYVLVGHSCGATLAFQTIADLEWPSSHPSGPIETQLTPGGPAAIVGIAGIYDLRLIRDNHADPTYQDFIQGAFGDDESVWDHVSPAKFTRFGKDWSGGDAKVVVLAHSRDDELVEEQQIETMARRLGQEDFSKLTAVFLNGEKALSGTHDALWEDGRETAKCIELVVHELVRRRDDV